MGAGPRRPARPRAAADDMRLTQAPAGTELGDLLERGEIDFLMTANNPLSFRRGAPNVERLFPELRARWRRTTTGAPGSTRSCTPW